MGLVGANIMLFFACVFSDGNLVVEKHGLRSAANIALPVALGSRKLHTDRRSSHPFFSLCGSEPILIIALAPLSLRSRLERAVSAS